MGNFNDIDHNLRTVTQLLQLEMTVTLICFLMAPGRKEQTTAAKNKIGVFTTVKTGALFGDTDVDITSGSAIGVEEA